MRPRPGVPAARPASNLGTAAKDLGEPTADGTAPPLIDCVHRLTRLWKTGGQSHVDGYLEAQGLWRNGLFKQKVQAVLEFAKPGTDECATLEYIQNPLGSGRRAGGGSAAWVVGGVGTYRAVHGTMDMEETPDDRASTVKLESLSISSFRGIDKLDIPKLGRVTLLAGKNGVGKTTVLEALSVYASRGRLRPLREILTRRDEWASFSGGNQGDKEVPALDHLFYEGEDTRATISVGPARGGPVFEMEYVGDHSALPTEVIEGIHDRSYEEDLRVLRVAFGTTEHFYVGQDIRRLQICRGQSLEFGSPIRCRWVGPQIVFNRQLARLWDQTVRENLESLALDSLRLVYGDEVERAPVMIGDSNGSAGRRAVVKLRHRSLPVPLRSLGDGTTRILSIMLSLAGCRDGILLVDEVENGIHYSLQEKLWSMIFRTANEHNVQVLAATHSKDCIYAFAAAASNCPNVDGNLVSIGRRKDKLRAVDYSIEDLEAVAEQNFEVR